MMRTSYGRNRHGVLMGSPLQDRVLNAFEPGEWLDTHELQRRTGHPIYTSVQVAAQALYVNGFVERRQPDPLSKRWEWRLTE